MNLPRNQKSDYEVWEEKVERRKARAARRIDLKRTREEERKIAEVQRALDREPNYVSSLSPYWFQAQGRLSSRPYRFFGKLEFKAWTRREIDDYIKKLKDKKQQTEDQGSTELSR